MIMSEIVNFHIMLDNSLKLLYTKLYNTLRIFTIGKSNINMEKTHIIEKQSHYIEASDNGCSKEINSRFAAVNCAGVCVLNTPFVTDTPAGRNDYYLQYMVSGELSVRFDENVRPGVPDAVMKPGDMILYYPHTHFCYRNNTSDISYCWVHFSGSGAGQILTDCGFPDSEILSPGVDDRITAGFERIFQDFILRGQLFELSLSKNLVRLLCDLAVLCRKSAPKRSSDERVDRVIALMHRSYNRELTMSELAAAAFVSEGYLRALFQEKCGMSPKKYLNAIRISEAKQLLTQTSLGISEIADAVGFADPLYFSQVFRKSVGAAPSEFRKVNSDCQ